jgi:SAM-dependent methyltransferase
MDLGYDASRWWSAVHARGWLRCSCERQQDGSLRVRGAFALPHHYSAGFRVMLNDRFAKGVITGLPGDPIFNYRGYQPNGGGPGFEFFIPASEKPPFRISITDWNGQRLSDTWQDWVYLEETALPFPGENLQLRINATSDDWYHLGGGTFAAKIPEIVRRFDRKPMNSISTVVDWGCGTGRITRHLPKAFTAANIIGVDTDRDAIEWAREYSPGVIFRQSPVLPPMPVGDHEADLIISHSVFAQLTEAHQFSWLPELRRVVKSDGLVLASTLSELAPFVLPVEGAAAAAISSGGFCCFDTERVVDLAAEAGYSARRLAYHSYAYIREVWGKYFEVLGILEGYADFLALVVMRPKG